METDRSRYMMYISAGLLMFVVVHSILSIQPAEGFDRYRAWIHQCVNFGLSCLAFMCSAWVCWRNWREWRGKGVGHADGIAIMLLFLRLLFVLGTAVGVRMNYGVLFLGEYER
jgi:hypothetical protein